MRALLDTHTFIGLDSTPAILSDRVRYICKDPANTLFISLASIWEMQIKICLGKLSLPRPLAEIVQWQQTNNLIQVLPITLPHIYTLATLPHHHRDPFDRMLIAQAQIETLTLLSRDREFSQYAITVVW